MKRKLMALMLAGIMVIQSAGTSWAAEFTDGVNVEYGDSSENVNEEAFSDEQTEAENFEDDSPEKDLTEEAEVPAMASGSTSDENLEVSFNNGTLTISGSGMITQTSVKNCGHSLSEIKKVIIKKGITSIGACAFYVCSSLNSIEIPNSVTSIGNYAFYSCSSLNSIEIPNSVTSIGDYAFYSCSSLNSIEIPNSVTSIGWGAFEDCSSLNSIEISNSVRSIGEWAFAGCSSLNSIEIPNSVTSIGWDAFEDCSSLNSIEIPNSVRSIGDWAFDGCNSLTDVYYTGNKTQWEKVDISSYGNQQLSKATIHYNSTISTNKKFNLSIKSPAILGNQNSISVDFEASTPGNVANEEKAITWKSSNLAIAEIDKNATELIDSVDGNRASGWISLLAYDVGEVTITGTTQDGRTASIEINVEPKLQTQTTIINISEKNQLLCVP